MKSFRLRVKKSNPLLWFMLLKPLDKIILLLTAVFILSPFGPYILDFGGFIFEAPFFLVAGSLLISRPSIIEQLVSFAIARRTVLVTVFLASCLALGIYIHGDVFSAYSDFRASLLFFLSFFFFYSRSTLHQSLLVLYALAFLSAVLSILFFLTMPFEEPKIAFHRGGAALEQYEFPIMTAVILMYISSIRSQPVLFVIASVLSGFMAVFGFYRAIWLIAGFGTALFSCLMLARLITRKRVAYFLYASVLISGLVALGFYFFGDVIGFLSSSEVRYTLTIGKFKELADALLYGGNYNPYDQLRIAYSVFMFNYWPELLFPHGLGYEHFVGNIDPFFARFPAPANTVDSGYLFSAFHFGLIFSIPFLVFILHALSRRTRYASSTVERLYVISAFFIVAFYFAINGDMFTVIERAFFIGSFLGILLNWRAIEGKVPAASRYREKSARAPLPPRSLPAPGHRAPV